VTLFAQFVAEEVRRRWHQMVEAEGVFFESAAEEADLREQACRLVVAYIEQLGEEPRPLLVEAKLKAPLVDPETGEDLGLPLMGIVDLVLEGERGPVIVDFKTAARAPAANDLVHELQLTCYSYLVRQVTGQEEASLEIRSLVKTKTPKVVTYSASARTALHYRRLFAVLRAYLQAMDERRDYVRPGIECGYCDFREVCLAA
jgi:CRISPR/Cas system-associated exonuclease Cas4 (RecB family)